MKKETITTNPEIKKIDITSQLSNNEIIQQGEDYCIMGVDNGVLFDGDLEEFLSESGIEIKKMIYLREVEYDGCSISNFKEGETMGCAEVSQNGTIRYFKVFSSREMAEAYNEFIDFSTTVDIKTIIPNRQITA